MLEVAKAVTYKREEIFSILQGVLHTLSEDVAAPERFYYRNPRRV